MPELPEVETVKRTLEPYIKGQKVAALWVFWNGTLVNVSAADLQEHLVGARLGQIERRGKYLGIYVEERGILVVHLRMTGRLVVRAAGAERATHLRLLLALENGREIHFVDQRKFGKVFWANSTAEFESIAHVGPEPLAAEFTPAVLAAALANSRAKVKACLLDQQRIAGLGNIYADESLFRAGIHPGRTAGSLSVEEVDRLWEAIRASLQAGIDHGGTTLRDYVDGQGRQGDNQNFLLVYGKAKEPCPQCGNPLERTRVAGRGTVYCPRCQK